MSREAVFSVICFDSLPDAYQVIKEKMKRPIVTGFLVLLAVVLIAAGVRLKREVSIDGCLDRGGQWNYDVAACEGTSE
ncbi:hypothetical protein [Janthinobacterium sp. RB2R34]|uniref:hypothetical protein n=1 Tax=Janthinobacterium sp. RB2R34 TaxID=3424193 RepID=UPI003F25932F